MYIGNRDSTRVLPPTMMVYGGLVGTTSSYLGVIHLDENGAPTTNSTLSNPTPARKLTQIGKFFVAEFGNQIAVHEISPEGTLENSHIHTAPLGITSVISIARTPTPNRFLSVVTMPYGSPSAQTTVLVEFKVNPDGTLTQTGESSPTATDAIKGFARDAHYVHGGRYVALVRRPASSVSIAFTLSISGDEDNKVFDVVDSVELNGFIANGVRERPMAVGRELVDGFQPVSVRYDEAVWIDSSGNIHSQTYSYFDSFNWSFLGFDRLSRAIHSMNYSSGGRMVVSTIHPDGSISETVVTTTDNVAMFTNSQDFSTDYGFLSGCSVVSSSSPAGVGRPCTVRIMPDGSTVLLGKHAIDAGFSVLYCPQGHRPRDL